MWGLQHTEVKVGNNCLEEETEIPDTTVKFLPTQGWGGGHSQAGCGKAEAVN